MKKIILIDGNSLIFKGYYATAYGNYILKTRSGKYTNALLSFAKMINKIITEDTFSHFLVLFDTGKPTFRKDIDTEYKANRKEAPKELQEQFDYVYRFLKSAGIKYDSMDGYEADDLIGSYAKELQKEGFDVSIYSGDTDLLQLIDKKITVNVLGKGTSHIVYDLEKLNEEYGFTPNQFMEYLALVGDPSDNIKGITGIGNKTGINLLKEHGSVKGIYENIDLVKGKIKEALLNEKEDLLNKYIPLAKIKTDVPNKFKANELAFNEYSDSINNFCKEFELFSFMNLIKDKTAGIKKDLEYTVISSDKEFSKLDLKESSLYIELDSNNYHIADLIGVGIATSKDLYFLEKDFFLESNLVRDYLINNKKITYDLKKNIVFLNRYGIEISNVTNDIMLANYLVDVDFGVYELSQIANMYGIYDLANDNEIYKKDKQLSLFPDTKPYEAHIVKKVKSLLVLNKKLLEKLEKEKQLHLLNEIEIPLSYALAKAEIEGIYIDNNILENFIKEYEFEIDKITDTIHNLAGEKFNIGSPKQLGEILYVKLGLTPPQGSKTKTGYSTSQEFLDELESKHEIISYIMEYRHLTKIYQTYLLGIKEVIHSDNKVHTIYNQTLTKTGRLSSILPNMQNIPVIGKGREIRKMFSLKDKNTTYLSFDYSQIELRILAHFADSKKLKEDFLKGNDVHTETAREIFDNPTTVTAEMRKTAKAINFGIIYGLSSYGLSKDLKIPLYLAEKYLDNHKKTYPNVTKYMNSIVEEARKTEYVETLFKRRRYLRNINDSNKRIRESNERFALNTPIQGTAADIIKIAMVRIDEFLTKNNYKTKMVLQVHDELIFIVPNNELKEITLKLEDLMDDFKELSVQLKVSKQIGKDLLLDA